MRMKACTCGSHLSSALYRIFFTSLFLSTALCSVALPIHAGTDQQSSAPAVTPTAVDEKSAPEITSHDVISTFKVDVNLVTARVVVRDTHGRPVRNLRREQFRIFDEGKLQNISRFSVEETAAQEPERAAGTKQAEGSMTPQFGEATFNPALPDRYVAIVIDDINTNEEDLIRAKQAAERYLVEAALTTTRVAMFSTSGATTLDFTDDRERLRHALSRVQHRSPARANVGSQCPYLNYYLADLIINKNDQRALAVVVDDLHRCMHTPPGKQDDELARAAAMSELQAGVMSYALHCCCCRT
ncbi:MAG TPA: VWA domain-containing protein [Terriglobales bacterium]|nr:VWA domain-containing protein [Terriglobales bacterium]